MNYGTKVKSILARRGFLYELNRSKMYWLMLAPAFALVIILCYIPMAGGVIAFKNYNYKDGIFLSPWNGFKNFEFFFKSGKAAFITWNTVLYNLIFLTVNNALSILLALFLSEIGGKHFKKITQSLIFLPYFISWVVVSALVYNTLNGDFGILNTVRKSIGMMPVDVYSKPSAWYIIFPILKAWKEAGWSSILYFAAIMGIDQECYESADIDGANIFMKIRHITLPMIVPTVVILVLLSIGRIIRGDFDMFYQTVGTNGLLFNATDIIDTFVFRSLMTSQDFGMASAAGLYQSVIGFGLIMTVNFIIKKSKPEYTLF